VEYSLRLHTEKDTFVELVNAAASHFGIPAVYVEKDYWVTMALLRLQQSKCREEIVFKGGTALSKAQHLIQRFSEDIDLAVRSNNLGDAQRKKLIKGVETAITQDLDYQADHPMESKGSRFRKTAHRFPILTDAAQFGQVSDTIIIELNAFAKPEPAEPLRIATLIEEFLQSAGREELSDRFGLESFEVWVLNVERTMCEKIMGLVRASHEEDTDAEYTRRIRHFYDLVMIISIPKYREFVEGNDFASMIREVRSWDLKSMPGANRWLDHPIAESEVFANAPDVWSRIQSEFHGSFKEMVYGDSLPTDELVIETLNLIGSALARIPSHPDTTGNSSTLN